MERICCNLFQYWMAYSVLEFIFMNSSWAVELYSTHPIQLKIDGLLDNPSKFDKPAHLKTQFMNMCHEPIHRLKFDECRTLVCTSNWKATNDCRNSGSHGNFHEQSKGWFSKDCCRSNVIDCSESFQCTDNVWHCFSQETPVDGMVTNDLVRP